MNARRLRSTTLAVLGALVGVLALYSSAAEAEVIHSYLSQIGGVFPSAMTVDSGELYVAESSGRLAKFDDSTGAFISQFPSVTPPPENLTQGFAVNHATGESYVGGLEFVEGFPYGVLGSFDAAGKLQAVWNGSDTPNLNFGCSVYCNGSVRVAVDNSTSVTDWAAGDVYVSSPRLGVVDVFKPKAGGGEEYVTQLTGTEPGAPFVEPLGVAVDQAGRVLVLDGQSGVDIFEPTALNEYTFVTRISESPLGPLENMRSLAVDGGNGDIYISATPSAQPPRPAIYQFNSAGVYLGKVGLESVSGIYDVGSSVAIDPSTHDLYATVQTAAEFVVAHFGPSLVIPDATTISPSGLKPTSATLNGTVNPDNAGEATCQFEYGTSSKNLGSIAPCSASVPDGESPVAVQAQIEVQSDTTYYYRLRATNANGTTLRESAPIQEFKTPGQAIHQESASVVTSVSSTLNASIDPNNSATTYYFQYGTSSSYGTDVPSAPGVALGSGSGDLSVHVHLQGLASGTTYHYRVVAVAEPGGELFTVYGPDKTFTTQTSRTTLTPPDGRAWEMVTPPNKQGSTIDVIGFEAGDDIQAAADGHGITFGASAPFVENPAGNDALELSQVISTRKAPGVWESQDITTPHPGQQDSEFALSHSNEYKLFSTDLSLGFVEPKGHYPLPPLPAGSEKTVYLRDASGGYTALVTAANTAPGAHFGGNEGNYGGVQFDTATPDLSHIVLAEVAQLTSTPVNECGSVIWEAGTLSCAEGNVTSSRHGISDDGSRVIGSEFQGHTGLDLHDLVKKETVQVDAAQGSPEPELNETTYNTASTDASRVFFESPQRLTADSTATPQHANDLYVYEVTSAAGAPLAGQLTDLTVDANEGETAKVRGVIGASNDGSYVYFVAAGLLGDAAERGAVNGTNLYVVHYDGAAHSWDAPHFITELTDGAPLSSGAPSSGDSPDWEAVTNNLVQMTARVSPNGSYLSFMSQKSLTGYDNTDANSGAADEEVYLYDAQADRLVCASCNPTGARPTGVLIRGGFAEHLVDWTAGLWAGRYISGNVPGYITNTHSPTFQSRYLSDTGRMFFNSSDALVPADVNGKEDVYEYEPAGLASCQAPDYGQSASVVFSETLDGCVALISAGTSEEESAFMDASETGGDVFFLTLSQLSPNDLDTNLDIYDAHECTASAPCAPPTATTPPPCSSGDACKPAPTPQPGIFGAPPSETFSGAGNVVSSGSKPTVKPKLTTKQKLVKALKVCRKKPRPKRAACERQARKRYAAKRARTGKSLSTRTRR